ncbi:MAG: SprB repeat-containing protein, partial [Bacteroidia bacterium]|nr:SprB repeat-containing protein [Bacteroidia bacterium]
MKKFVPFIYLLLVLASQLMYGQKSISIALIPKFYHGGFNTICHGSNEGEIQSLVTGGVPPYQYNWSNGANTTHLLNAGGAGTYTLTVQDANGKTKSASITLYDPPPLTMQAITSDYSGYGLSADGFTDGKIELRANGGVPPYKAQWMDISDSMLFRNQLGTGLYTYRIRDANGCFSAFDSTLLTSPDSIAVTIIQLDSASCNKANGKAFTSVSGGVPPYIISWSNGEQTDTAQRLSSGLHYVFITDANFNRKKVDFTLAEAPGLSAFIQAGLYEGGFNTSCHHCSDGYLKVHVSGGYPPYSIHWQPANETADSIYGLGQGFYAVTVTDAKSCKANASTGIFAPPRPDWTMSGNAETDPQNQFIGTTDSTDVVFRTNNTEALRLAANKNIGVGVNEPTARLDVSGTVRIREDILIDSLAFTPDSNNTAQFRILMTDENG